MKLIQEHKKCIGCGSCAAVCSRYFDMGEDGLAFINGGKEEGENQILEITEDIDCAKEAVEICPVQIIKVE